MKLKNLTPKKIIKWLKMITGRSILHVNQGPGKIYSKTEIKGYYNDLTEKVLKGKLLNINEVPTRRVNKKNVEFSIEIFQYGLACYDLFLIEKNNEYLEKFQTMVNWALENQAEDGSWITFAFDYSDAPYSAMAQGEGASLLLRAYTSTQNNEYLLKAKKAIEFMLIPISKGGTAVVDGDELYFKEFTCLPVVLNGWIFALFGLFDYQLVSKSKEIKQIIEQAIITLENNLEKFDNGFWSMYDIKEKIASPFYHNLHIAQLQVLYDLTGKETFRIFYEKWEKYRKKRKNRRKAFWLKAKQKLNE